MQGDSNIVEKVVRLGHTLGWHSRIRGDQHTLDSSMELVDLHFGLHELVTRSEMAAARVALAFLTVAKYRTRACDLRFCGWSAFPPLHSRMARW